MYPAGVMLATVQMRKNNRNPQRSESLPKYDIIMPLLAPGRYVVIRRTPKYTSAAGFRQQRGYSSAIDPLPPVAATRGDSPRGARVAVRNKKI